MLSRILPALAAVAMLSLLVGCAVSPTATPVAALPTLTPPGIGAPTPTVPPNAAAPPTSLPNRYPPPDRPTAPPQTYPSPGPTLATSKATAFPTKVPTAAPEPDVATDLMRRMAHVDEIQVSIMESYPVQVGLTLYGYLGDGCTELTGVAQSASTRGLEFHALTARPRGAICTKALVPFEEQVMVDISGLGPGTYLLDVNGITATLDLSADMLAEPAAEQSACPRPAPGDMVHRKAEHGYCFSYPDDMVICRPDASTTMVLRIVQDGLGEAQVVTIEALGPAYGQTLKEAVSTRLPQDIAAEQAQVELGGELAISVSSDDASLGRRIYVIHDGTLYVVASANGLEHDWEVIVSSLSWF